MADKRDGDKRYEKASWSYIFNQSWSLSKYGSPKFKHVWASLQLHWESHIFNLTMLAYWTLTRVELYKYFTWCALYIFAYLSSFHSFCWPSRRAISKYTGQSFKWMTSLHYTFILPFKSLNALRPMFSKHEFWFPGWKSVDHDTYMMKCVRAAISM